MRSARLLFSFAVVLGGCGAGPAPGPTAERMDSAGVEIVRNRGADVSLDWSFENTLVLGGADDGAESFYGVGHGSVAVDDAGDLYILDRGNHRVVVFDAEGRHLRTMGRKGGGPGELQMFPAGLAIAPDGSVNVYDIGKRGLVRFGADGSVLPERRIEAPLWGGRYAITGHGIVVQATGSAADGDGRLDMLATLTEAGDTAAFAAYPQTPGRPVDFGCVSISGMTPLLSPDFVWTAGGDRVLLSAHAGYAIEVFEGGRRVASIRRELEPVPATRSHALREVGDKMEVRFGGGGSCVVQPDEVVEKRGFAETLPAIRAIAIGRDGTIWVQRFAMRGEDAPIDLLAADGAYIGTLPAGTPFPAAFLPDGRIAAVERDELDVPRVVVYRIVYDRESELPG